MTAPPPVERLFLEDPYRKTVLTEVAAVHGAGVLLPRSIWYATSRAYGHPQPSDRGHLLVGGHKLKLARVAWRDDGLAHVVSGPPPRRGEKVLGHLDWERRHEAMRAHAALHLLAHVVVAERRGEFLAAPEVHGRAQFRVTLRLAATGPKGLADAIARANAIAERHLDVVARWLPRDEAERRATSQHVGFDRVAPGEPVLRVVETGDVVRVPCDAPALRNTREVGRIQAVDVLPRPDAMRVVFRLAKP